MSKGGTRELTRIRWVKFCRVVTCTRNEEVHGPTPKEVYGKESLSLVTTKSLKKDSSRNEKYNEGSGPF